MKNRLMVAACILALAASVFLLVFPTGEGDWGGQHHRTTLLDKSGSHVLALLALPVLITLLPLGVPRHGVRIGASILLFGLVILGGFSIGLFYLPAAVAEVVGAGLYFDS
jgi:hypothetical protein